MVVGNKKRVKVLLSVDPDILKALDECAIRTGISRSSYLINALCQYWKNLNK